MRSRGLCEPAAFFEWRKRLYDLVVSIGLSFLALIALAYLFKLSSDYSRGWMLTWLALVFVLLPASRPLSAKLLRWLTATGSTVRRIAVVASELAGLQFAERLRATPGVAVAGIFQLSKESEQQGATTVADLINMGQRNEFDEVVIAASDALQPGAAQLVEELRVLPVDVWVYAADLDMPIHGVSRLGDCEPVPGQHAIAARLGIREQARPRLRRGQHQPAPVRAADAGGGRRHQARKPRTRVLPPAPPRLQPSPDRRLQVQVDDRRRERRSRRAGPARTTRA